ncbi:MAG: NADH-ubiquinone oxidoreductase-F iron-sulfur binding region domain-containing protein [Candidatus Fermentibacteraceae bacterium]
MAEEKRVMLGQEGPETGSALRKALSLKPADVAFEVREAKLLGRGGAGFPTGVKWVLAGGASGERKYIICNADEGEPGTFKDRVLLEEYTEKILEGMAIAGHAIDADTGIIYLRAEYPYLIPRIMEARQNLIDQGLLGENIGGTDFSFDIEIRPGAGAYVCGEETSLMESMEGRRGEPRNKPPFPTNQGFLGMPTVINNVETFAAIPHIVLEGAEWYQALGHGENSGTKLFSVSGDVENPGVYELPLGSSVCELLELAGAEDTQAVQVGGASGATIGPDELQRCMSFADLPPGGSVIVFDESRDMLDVLENFMEFFVHESCGQCTPCREGNMRLLDAIADLKAGRFESKRQLKPYFQLAETMRLGGKCGLGQTSSNCFVDIVSKFVDLPDDAKGDA